MMKRILSALDFSDVTAEVLHKTLEIATQFDSQVLIVHVEKDPSNEKKSEEEQFIFDHQVFRHQSMEFIKHDFKEAGIDVLSLLLEGQAHEKIMREVTLYKPSLIVVGSHHNSCHLNDFLYKAGEHIIHHAPCPVLVVPSQTGEQIAKLRNPLGIKENILHLDHKGHEQKVRQR